MISWGGVSLALKLTTDHPAVLDRIYNGKIQSQYLDIFITDYMEVIQSWDVVTLPTRSQQLFHTLTAN